MLTYTGRYVDVMNLRPVDISIFDIAHHLSNIGRFNGATKYHYSVAQHSYYCSLVPCKLCVNYDEREHAKKKLMHDAEEAYLMDVPRPIKRLPEFASYRAKGDESRGMIFGCFGLTPDLPECVHEADNAMLVNEGIKLMSHRYTECGNEIADILIEPMRPQEAEELFLHRYRQLFLE